MSHLRSFRQSITRFQAARENLPFVAKSFDVVTMIEVLGQVRHMRLSSQAPDPATGGGYGAEVPGSRISNADPQQLGRVLVGMQLWRCASKYEAR